MKYVLNLCLVVVGSAILAEPSVTTNGTELTISVPSGEEYAHVEAVPSSFTKITKDGLGSCVFAPSTITFTGTFIIQQGTIHGDRAKFGSPKEWTIADGGALRFDVATDEYKAGEWSKPSGKLSIGGFGCDGLPAYYFTMLPNGSPYTTTHGNFGGGVTLTSDTSVGGGRLGFATTDMQGYDIYTYCTNGQAQFEMYSAVKNAGNIHIKKGGLLVERAMTFSPALTNQYYEMADGTKIIMYGHPDTPSTYQASTPDIRLEPNASATIECTGNGATSASANTWQGDWHLGTGKRILLNVTAVNRYGSMKGAIDGAAEIYKSGNGVYTITTNASHAFGQLTVGQGTLTLGANADGSAYQVTNKWTVGGTATGASTPRLNIGPNARTVSDGKISTSGITVGYNGGTSAMNGIVSIGDGAVVSNAFLFGNAASTGTACGALYLDDATVFWKAGGGNDGFIGQNGAGYGCVIQNAGSLTHNGYMNLGAVGRGVYVQRGGLHRIATGDPLKFARTGSTSWGCYHQTGGTFTGSNAWFLYNNVTNCSASEAILTTTGTNSLFSCTENKVYLSCNKVTTTVNVNDGATFKGRLYREFAFGGYDSANWSKLAPACTNTTHLYLNLNGGILKAGSSAIFGSDRMRGPSRITVYEKGATFDTTDSALVVNTPLERPFGKGLKSITLPKNSVTNFNYYVGSPRIKITSQTGTGATAFADFNEKTRQVERIVVTGPGCGYEDASISIENNVHGAASVSTFELAELSVTGGVTKVGPNTLTLACANTYGGTTRIDGGTLAFTHVDGMPGGDVEFTAAALAGGAKTQPLLTADTFKAAKIRVANADMLDKDTFGSPRAVATFTNPLSELPTIEFADSTGASCTAPAWKFLLKDGGRTLIFGYSRGTVVIFR